MAFRDSFTFILVFLSFCFLSTTASTLGTVVDIRNGLPNDSNKQLTLCCGQGSSSNLKQGDHYNQTLTVDQDFECTATRSRWFAAWNAYKSERDKGHGTVYWAVKQDGFYHSWDGLRWRLMENWSTDR